MKAVGMGWLAGAVATMIVAGAPGVNAEASEVAKQIAPMRQDSIKISTLPELPKPAVPQTLNEPTSAGISAQPTVQASIPAAGGTSGYDPAGRRDPFAPILEQLQPGKTDETLPPLQRVTLNELNLIAVIWGGYGYTAMVQTPDGHGYTVRRGTRVGQNNGVVSAVTERGIIVQERFTDVYGRKQEREFVKLLHPKEGAE